MQSNLESRRKKVVGEPDEGKPHVRFEVAGNGNQAHHAQAPFPDPTSGLGMRGQLMRINPFPGR
ncbi:MAG TPA: hypothetical protein VLA72_23220 [Anaerolineales bacterium]|nr:hypothetical protein [Anaerolineales bacterium]